MANFAYKGYKIFYTSEGEGAPIVFIHGLGGNSINWLYQRNAFKSKYQAIAIDLPGHGKSEGKDVLTYDDYHKILYQLLHDVLEVKDVLLCGVSMGGRVAIDYAYFHPEMVKAMMIADTYAGMDAEEIVRRKKVFDLMLEPGGPKIWVKRVKEEMGFDPEGHVARGFEKGMLNNPLEFLYNLFVHGLSYDQRPMLPSITVPALILHGERDRFVPMACAEKLHDELVRSDLVIVDDCGHLPNVEQPKVFNHLLEDFIKRIEF